MKCVLLILLATVTFDGEAATEIDWHPVEQVRASVEQLKLQKGDKVTPTTAVVVTGLVPVKRQVSSIARTLKVSEVKAVSSAEVFDFTVERQELAIGEKSRGKTLAWKELDVKSAGKVLEDYGENLTEIVSPSYLDPVYSMPLPRLEGAPPKSLSHPELSPDYQLFRFIDFTAQPGRHYRYRVLLKWRNPNFEDSPDPFIANGELRPSTWSVPSAKVTIVP